MSSRPSPPPPISFRPTCLPPDLPEGEPGRSAHLCAGRHLADPAALRRSTNMPKTSSPSRFPMVPGVAQVTVNGSAKYAVRVQLNPDALASRQIGIDEVEQAIQNANVNMPMGTLFGAHKAYNIESNGQLSDAAALSPVHRRLPQWRPGAARSGRHGHRRSSGSLRRQLDQRHSGHHAGRSAAARHEHHRDRQSHPQAHSALLLDGAAVDQPLGRIRSIGSDPRVGQRRQVHASSCRYSGRSCHLPVPAKRLRHHHAEPGPSRWRSSARSR